MKNVPNLRFKEFSEEWKNQKFKDIVRINQGLQIAISDRYTEDGENRYFYITNEFLNKNSDKKYYIENPPSSVICQESDILMTRTGNTGRVVTGVSGAFHNNFFKINYDVKKHSQMFLYYVLTSFKVQKNIMRLAGTSTIPDLNHGDFYNIKISYPVLEEQEKIASFFSLIDKKIEFQTEKVEVLKKYKKGIMQKIFSQELRFKDDNGNEFPEWEEKKLGKVCEIKKGQQLNKEFLLPQGKYYALNGGVEPSGFTDKYNTERGVISISEGGNSCGYVKYNNERFWSGGHCYTLENTLDFIDSKYLFQFLKYNELKIMALRVGSGLPNIQKSALSNFIIKIPEYSEQLQIGNLLYLIDTKIIKEEEMLDLLNQYKKGLLQQMFV